MSDYTDQLAVIYATVTATVGTAGVVHDFPRYGDVFSNYVKDDQVNGWEIGLDAPGTIDTRETQGHRKRERHWRIQGYIAVLDVGTDGNYNLDEAGSYKTINDTAVAIADALEADFDLGGTALSHDPVTIEEPLQITIGGGVLCWGVSIIMRAISIV